MNPIKMIIIALLGLASIGCAAQHPVSMNKLPPTRPCPLPEGYVLENAVQTAEATLTTCPQKLDPVFTALLTVGSHNPHKENRIRIKEMLKRLSESGTISTEYAKERYRQYFSKRFVSLPDVKTYHLPKEIDGIKVALNQELGFKKIGLIECCGDKEGYATAEAEMNRIIRFLDNLIYNESYFSSQAMIW